jgi:CRISPR-associated protein Cas5t
MQNTIALFVSVSVASFRVPRAKEYFETLPCPPPSTIYGMLLSLVGETNRHAHEGAEIPIALMSQPEYSVVLRTLWRVKSRKQGLGQGENKTSRLSGVADQRPDHCMGASWCSRKCHIAAR